MVTKKRIGFLFQFIKIVNVTLNKSVNNPTVINLLHFPLQCHISHGDTEQHKYIYRTQNTDGHLC